MAVFEMLWDCPYCGTKKLLGKTHRFCPRCGAPQDPARRYFPPDEEKVAVENHEYVGADRICGACDSAMSARAAHCTQCGAPMEGTAEARRVTDGPAPSLPKPVAPAGGSGCKRIVRVAAVTLGALAVAVATMIIVALVWRKTVEVRVAGHDWERLVDVESFDPTRETEWCDQMPGGAYDVTRSREVRSQRQVPEGEECTERRVDQGDGTYREERDCRTRYRDEPIYDDRCRYTVDRWKVARTARAAGDALDPAPAWPVMSLRAGSCHGCEREGRSREEYRVRFVSQDGRAHDCAFDEKRWRSFAVGARYRVKVGVLTGSISCGSLDAVGH
jgi:hypothetical protein